MSEEWGPWIEHDGKGCPCKGMWVQREIEVAIPGAGFVGGMADEIISYDGFMAVVEGRVIFERSWNWINFGRTGRSGGALPKVLRYRIRKPRALQQLRDMIADLPAPAPAKEDA